MGHCWWLMYWAILCLPGKFISLLPPSFLLLSFPLSFPSLLPSLPFIPPSSPPSPLPPFLPLPLSFLLVGCVCVQMCTF